MIYYMVYTVYAMDINLARIESIGIYTYIYVSYSNTVKVEIDFPEHF